MTEKLKQTIKEEVMKLSKEAQEAINVFDWVKVAEEIGKKYSLNESKINNFQVETLLVLVGLEEADIYAQNIENNVGTSKGEAKKMADEAFTKIFYPIKNMMEENIKKNMKNRNIKPEDNINFILSGGNYSVFIAPTSEDTPHPSPLFEKERENNEKISGYTINTPPKMMEMKNKFLYDKDKNQ